MTTTILTDEQVGDLYQDWYCFFKDNPGSAALCIRAIEQAVLQSEQVQAWKRDAERWKKLAGHVYEIKRTYEKSADNHVNRLRLDIKKSSVSLTKWLEDAVDDFVVSDAAMEK